MALTWLKEMFGNWGREERNKINENWEKIEDNYSSVLKTSNDATETAQKATTTANEAKTIAEGIDGKATQALDTANQADSKSDSAVNIATQKGNAAIDIANQANDTSNYVQSQLDNVIAEGDSSAEVVQARAEFVTLRERLDAEKEQVTSQLTHIEDEVSSEVQRLEDEKAGKAEVISSLGSKRNVADKIKNTDLDTSADANKIKLANLADEVIQSITGNAPVNNVIADGAVTQEKIAPAAINSEKMGSSYNLRGTITNGTNLNSIVSDGCHFGNASGGYVNLPPQFNTTRAFKLNVENLSTRWCLQTLTDFTFPFEKYVRVVDKSGTGTTAWSIDTFIPDKTVTTSKIADYTITNLNLTNNVLTNNLIANGTDIFTIKREGHYVGVGGASTSYVNMPLAMFAFSGNNLVQSTFALDVKVLGANYVLQTMYDVLRPEKKFHNIITETTSSDWFSYTGFNPNKYVVFFGDSITENGDYTERVAQKLGIRTINVGFGGCRMGQHVQSGNGLYYDKMCMHKLVEYIAAEDYTELREAAIALNTATGDNNVPIVDRLAAIDWSKVAIAVIGYMTNDYGGHLPIGTNSDATGATFKGAINKVIQTLLTKHPHVKIVFNTAIYRSRFESVSDGLDGDTYANSAGHTLRDYVDALKELCELHHIPYNDLYKNSGINKYNYAHYLSDGLHPNTANGYEHLASKVAAYLKAQFN